MIQCQIQIDQKLKFEELYIYIIYNLGLLIWSLQDSAECPKGRENRCAVASRHFVNLTKVYHRNISLPYDLILKGDLETVCGNCHSERKQRHGSLELHMLTSHQGKFYPVTTLS